MPQTPATEDVVLPEPARRLVTLFGLYVERYLQRHFHAVRLSKSGGLPPDTDEPLVIYLNHPSWWDPLVGMQVALRLFPEHRHHALIDAAALERYRFFARLGFIGIERDTTAGARRFLRVADRVLELDRTVLWLTPAGAFSDPRQRPALLEPGIVHLGRRGRRGLLLPMALEYPFWTERTPEALVRFGEPTAMRQLEGLERRDIRSLLAERLERSQATLAREAMDRSPEAFVRLLGGESGVGGIYGLWLRLRALAGRSRFEPEHASLGRRPISGVG